jgi:hypothetical protein
MAAITLDDLGIAALGRARADARDAATEHTGPPGEPEPREPGTTGCVLYTAESLHEAQLVLDRLDEAGIQAQVFNTHLIGALGELPMSQCWPKIWLVDRERFEDARGIVEDYESRKRTDADGVRTCHDCGEESPGNFELCWSCRAPLDD